MGSGENDKSPTKKSKQNERKPFVKEASPKTAHDWRKYENKEITDDGISPVEVEFYDDGTVTFFWYLQYICFTAAFSLG